MSSKNIVISVNNLSKCFQIYDRPFDRFKQFLFSRIQILRKTTSRKYCKDFWALQNITFNISRGGAVGIIGLNGSGKSTLLHIICGTLSPTKGEIKTKGRVAALLELGSGFNPEFSGRENIFLNASVLGLKTDEINERLDNILAFADIGDFIDQPVKTYSSGMLVRLAFAVIAHVDADILVIDEALAVGDAYFTQKCMKFIRNFMEEGTVLFVSHDILSIVNLCDSAIWLHDGRIKLQGEPKNVAQDYLANLNGTVNTNHNLIQKENSKQTKKPLKYKDMRLDFINQSKYRNDIEVFKFDPNAKSFGDSVGRIINVQLLDDSNNQLSWVVGGEKVCLKITCFAVEKIKSPIVGFFVNDRLGQTLFGDNTLSFCNASKPITKGREFMAVFEFFFPILPKGDYFFTVALAEGSQHEHVQHHWIHESLLIKSHSSSLSSGLIGIPMIDIKIN